jgi:cell wall-associated NlpC family hydrolase
MENPALAKFIGIPHKPLGDLADGVCDCWTLSKAVAADLFNLDLPPYVYQLDSYLDEAEGFMRQAVTVCDKWRRIDSDKRAPGDLILFKILGRTTHCGLYLGDDWFIHALSGRSSTLELLSSPIWNNRVQHIIRPAP